MNQDRSLLTLSSLFLLLFMTAAVSLPASAQQSLEDNEQAEIEDDGGVSYFTGYAQVEVSSDGTELDAWAENTQLYQGFTPPSWYGPLVDATLYGNGQMVDAQLNYSDDTDDTVEVDFEQPCSFGDEWWFQVGYGYMDEADNDDYWTDTLMGSDLYMTVAAETVSMTSVSVNPTSINATTSPTSATVTVMLNHSYSGSLPLATVDVTLATITPSTPPGNAISYPIATKTVNISGNAGFVTQTFTVNSIPGTTVQGNVVIGATLTNPQPSTITITSPNSAKQTLLTTSQ